MFIGQANTIINTKRTRFYEENYPNFDSLNGTLHKTSTKLVFPLSRRQKLMSMENKGKKKTKVQ